MSIKLNPNDELVQAIKFRLGVTGGFCPCHPEEIGNDDWKCPCKKFREDRVCCCELYIEE